MGQCLADLEILAQSTNPGFVAPQWVSVGGDRQIAAQARAATCWPDATWRSRPPPPPKPGWIRRASPMRCAS
ncbi:hypothetical protein [Arthrobacter sp. JCM 19049]|uniref:hypothetical protein n=1 Tax=Arthrobacter sp. JCM 19049 TaxID=1460643 RepID=UPI000A5C83E0|nr:hypothetical protein [Arthrobacter sp. JCM 19049]